MIVIAIDGFSSCGKSTLAKQLAKSLGYGYIDTGAMYRAVTLYFLQNDINLEDKEAISTALKNIHIEFKATEKGNTTFLNGRNVEADIRSMYVSNHVSPVAAISSVRRFLVKQQQILGEKKGIVMDGRDIGTVVFPNAELKIFVTAAPEERARRRFLEMQEKGMDADLGAISANLKERDHIDSTREDSPLKQAEDAVVIDNTHLTRDEQLQQAITLAKSRM